MTSSLVGSEMCIRDSAMTAHGAQGKTLKTVIVDLDINNVNQHKHGTVVTVSYTHLTLPTICSV
eukprot:741230-Prorocentrum_lima.AAC.1